MSDGARKRRGDRAHRKRAEQQLFEANQRLQALMNALPVGVSFSNDPTCQLITGNPAGLAQFDAGPGDNLSASAPDERAWGRRVRFFREGRPVTDAELPLQRAVAENRAIPPTELEVVTPRGRRWYADASAAPIRDAQGRAVGGVAVAVDITRRKEAEEGLRQANASLEQRIQERTAELEQRAAQLRALAAELTLSEQRERRRMAKLLHDHLQQLLAGAKFRTATLGRKAEPQVRQAVLEIENLLDTALGTSRSLTAELSPPILHEEGLNAGLEWLASWVGDRHGLSVAVSMEKGLPAPAEDVKVLLFESVRELLFNAVKHAHAPSATVEVGQVRGGDLQIVVADAGAGFDPATVKPAGEAGAGFGLFSIRERLDLIGGSLEIDSAPGKGSRFTLTVPLGRAAAVEPVAASAAQGAAGRQAASLPSPRRRAPIRVLLADDHAVVREGLRLLLGLQPDIEIVGEARDGVAAVEMAGRLRPDVVLMDIGMPVLDGVEATRAIRTSHPDVRVIGLSMFQDEERIQAIEEAGAVRYLSKAGPPADLIAAVLACADEQAGERAGLGKEPGVAEAESPPRRP